MTATVTARPDRAAKRPPRPAKPKTPPAAGGVPHPPPPPDWSQPPGPGGGSAPEPEVLDGLPFQALRLTAADPGPAKRNPLFCITVDGKERWYTVLADPPYNISLEYTHRVRTDGVGMALDWLLEAMLGAGGYAALRGYKGLTEEHVGQVIAICTALALGKLEVPKES